MIPIQAAIIAVAVSAAVAFGSAWQVQGWRYGAQISEMRAEQAQALAKANADALASTIEMQEQKDAAIKDAEKRAADNARDADSAKRESVRLRKQLTASATSISQAPRPAVDQYAATIGELFAQCVDEYRAMAERADQHYSDTIMLIEAWPRGGQPEPLPLP